MKQNDILIRISNPGIVFSHRVSFQSDSGFESELNIKKSANRMEVATAIHPDCLQAIALCSDQDLLIETNDPVYPDQMLSLKAGIPFLWYQDCGHAIPFSVPVNKFLISNSGGKDAKLRILIAQNHDHEEPAEETLTGTGKGSPLPIAVPGDQQGKEADPQKEDKAKTAGSDPTKKQG